jgi:hypothetical protein
MISISGLSVAAVAAVGFAKREVDVIIKNTKIMINAFLQKSLIVSPSR